MRHSSIFVSARTGLLRGALPVLAATAALAQDTLAPAVVFGPVSAASEDGRLGVTVVACISGGQEPRAAHALIEAKGALPVWTRLPFDDLPEAIVVPDATRIVFAVRAPDGALHLESIGSDGARDRDWSLSEHLPRESAIASVCGNGAEGTVTVSMDCGSVALVDLDPTGFDVCTWLPAPKVAVGVEAWLEQSRQLLRDGDVAAARFALDSALEADPDDARAYRALAQFHRRAGDDESALECLGQGVARLHASASGVADLRWRVGTPAARLALEYVEATREVRGADHAYAALDEALQLYPCMEQAVLLRAELQIAAGDDVAAVDGLRDALANLDTATDAAAAHHDVGRFLRKKGRAEDAIAFLEDAYALGDDSEFLLRGLAEILVESCEYERAAEWLARLAEQWRAAEIGESNDDRRRRAAERLALLELEIAELHQRAVLRERRDD